MKGGGIKSLVPIVIIYIIGTPTTITEKCAQKIKKNILT
jgi:hypothetical protein